MKQEKQKAGKVYKEGVTGTSLSHCCPAAAVPGAHSRCSGDLTSQQIQRKHWRGFLSVRFLQQDGNQGHVSLDIVTLPWGVPGTLRTSCCGSGEVFQQK